MGGVGLRAAAAHFVVAAGMVLVVAGVWLLLGFAFSLLVAGVLLCTYGLLVVNVPEQTERVGVVEPGVTPLGSAGASRAGR